MKTIHLHDFCSHYEDRKSIEKPWRVGGFVYASDGRIMIRVPAALYPEVGENPEAPAKVTDKSQFPWDHETLAHSYWKPATQAMKQCCHPPCIECGGRGTHTCPDCERGHECGRCDGWGRTNIPTSIDIGRVRLNSIYCYLLCQLPGVELWIHPRNNSVNAVPFRFGGGLGLGYVMPMRKWAKP